MTIDILARNSRHTVFHTHDSTSSLVERANAIIPSNNRIAVGVMSYKELTAVKSILDAAEFSTNKNVSVECYITRGYLLQQHPFNFKHRYDDNSKPWEYLEIDTEEDIRRLKKIEASPRWKKREEDISETVFSQDNGEGVCIVIMLNDALLSNLRELDHVGAHVIMFNPGINDAQRYCRVWQESKGKWKKVPERRPLSRSYLYKLRSLYVTLITGSQDVTDLIRTSQTRHLVPTPSLKSSSGPKRDFNVTLISSRLASKQFSGTLPIVLELLNKSLFDDKAILIGDGTCSLHSFNTLRSSTEMLDGPVILKVSHPSLEHLKNLSGQLGKVDNNLKKRIILDNVQSALRRINEGQDVYLICQPNILSWVKEIPEVKGTITTRTDVKSSLLHQACNKNKLNEHQSEFAGVLNCSIEDVAKGSKSLAAFNRYVRKNKIEGVKLEKLISNLLLAITFIIRERVDYIAPTSKDETEPASDTLDKPVPAPRSNFKFKIEEEPVVPEYKPEYASFPIVKDENYPKLLKLCMDVIKKHVGDELTKKSIFWRYDRDLKNQVEGYGRNKPEKKLAKDSKIG